MADESIIIGTFNPRPSSKESTGKFSTKCFSLAHYQVSTGVFCEPTAVWSAFIAGTKIAGCWGVGAITFNVKTRNLFFSKRALPRRTSAIVVRHEFHVIDWCLSFLRHATQMCVNQVTSWNMLGTTALLNKAGPPGLRCPSS